MTVETEGMDQRKRREENECKRQADTKDLTSSSKVLRVLGPNLTDAISFIQEIIKSREKEKEENKNKDW